MAAKKYEIGNRYGHLVVIKEHSTTRNGHIRYTCQCDCGAICNILITHLRQKNTTSCGCFTIKRIGPNHIQWTGIGEMSGDYWYNHITRSANGEKGSRKPVEFTITKEYIWNLFLSQNRKCALSGIVLSFPKHGKDKSYTISLDRIDSSKGYIPGNVQWVHKDINFMKNKYTQSYFISICRLIAETHSNN